MTRRTVTDMSNAPLIALSHVTKTYTGAGGAVHALRDLDLDIGQGEFVALLGKSGSGKTTLVNLLTGIDAATSGAIRIGATAVHSLDPRQLARWRGTQVGIVFQFFQLLPALTVLDNVMLPMDLCNVHARHARRARALALLADMGIEDQAAKLPGALSGGQQQRAAIARALANDPPLIVADEPTGNLDSRTAEEVMSYLAGLARTGKTVVTATHDTGLARHHARSVTLVDGVLHDGVPRDGVLRDGVPP